MRRYAWRLTVFLLPLLLVAVLIAAVDPFERFDAVRLFSTDAKAAAAQSSNRALWMVVHLDRVHTPNLLFGDSKIARLRAGDIRRVSGLEFTNVALGGASADDAIDLFWRAAKRIELRNVVIGVNLETFNRANNRDVVRAADGVADNPLLYIANGDVIVATGRLVASALTRREPSQPDLGMTRDQFWQYELDYGAPRSLQHFQFDTAALARYATIADYCRAHSIRLRFVLLPTHADIHQRIKALGLEREWRALPSRLSAVAETVDLDGDNEITADRDAFTDPFHMTTATAKRVVEVLFTP